MGSFLHPSGRRQNSSAERAAPGTKKARLATTCGKRHVMTEEEFDYLYPAPQENWQAAAASEAPSVAEAIPFTENVEAGTENLSARPIVDQVPADADPLRKLEALPSLLESPDVPIHSGAHIL